VRRPEGEARAGGPRAGAAADERRVRRSSAQIGVLVAIASAVVMASVMGALTILILAGARPEHRHVPGTPVDASDPGGELAVPSPDRVVVDVDRVLPWIVVLSVAAVVLLGVVAWIAARRAVAPLGEALRLQRNFVSDASHELRTPLTALSSRIQIAQRRQSRGEPLGDSLDRLRRDADAMNDVLTDLLVAAEAAADARSSSDVGGAVANAIETMQPSAHEHGARIVREVPAGLSAAIPGVTLARLLVALLDNALQHSPTGGTVRVTARAAARSVELRVRDEGPGIPPAELERIFERFARGAETGRRRGFGLGLALVREVAMRFDGRVAVESTSPQGTTFLVTLPAAR